jgi:hypothetical protein
MIELENWKTATNALAIYFIEKYFGNSDDCDWYWIADEIGNVLYVNDNFFEVNEMVDFLQYKYSAKKMFEYQDYHMKCIEDREVRVNIKNYKKLKDF